MAHADDADRRRRAKWKPAATRKSETPDLVINFKGKLEEKTDIESTPAPYYGPGGVTAAVRRAATAATATAARK